MNIYTRTRAVKCSSHPKYRAIKPPTLDCKVCKEIYTQKHMVILPEDKEDK